MSNNRNKKGDEIMKAFTMRMPPSLISQAQDKAGLVPLSVVIRTLIEKWLKGEITIEQTRD